MLKPYAAAPPLLPPPAGTPLGDPIEVGAAAAVLVEARRARAVPSAPLVLTASKSWLGHAEPAAGMVGMLHACHGISRGLAVPNAHLIELNPHVEHVLSSGTPAQREHWSLPRQQGALPSCGVEGSALRSGVSAFAFQVG